MTRVAINGFDRIGRVACKFLAQDSLFVGTTKSATGRTPGHKQGGTHEA